MVNNSEPYELSRKIKVKGLPGDAVTIDADTSEREALATRFGIPGIDRLHASVSLEQCGSSIRATGTLDAAIRQTCAISGEDFPARIREEVDLRFVQEETSPAVENEDGEIEVELDLTDSDEIEYAGDTFDLGEAVAQTLGLAIDPYAEGPTAEDARAKAGIFAEGEQDGPLAEALAALKKG